MAKANYSVHIDEGLKRRFEEKVARQHGEKSQAKVIRNLIREYVNKDERK